MADKNKTVRVKIASPSNPGPSDAVLALGREYAALDGVTVLAANLQRPDGYYTASHSTGLSNVAAGAFEEKPDKHRF